MTESKKQESLADAKETRDSGACMKVHCKQNLSSPILAIYIRHDDDIVKDNICSVSFTFAAQNYQKVYKKTYFGVQGHPKSLLSVPIESASW